MAGFVNDVWFDDEALMKVFSELCLRAEIKVVEMPEGLRRRQTSNEMFWFNYGKKTLRLMAALLHSNQS